MLKFVILLSAVACALGGAIPEGMIPQLDGRIAGGEPTIISAYPWQVSIQHSGSYLCAGAIYSDKIIVTTADCLKFVSASDLTVRAGSAYWNSGGSLVDVAAIRIHGKYNVYNMINDIAVIRLSTPLTFSEKIKSIALAAAVPANATLAAIAGWGTTVSGEAAIPDQLKFIDVQLIRREICASDLFGYKTAILPTMICAADVDKGFCKGDSGSGLVFNGTLVGIASWGCGCADAKFPGVFASIPALRGWVTHAATVV